MGLSYSQLADAVALTQEHLIKRGAFLDMQTDLQDHVLVRELWKGRNKKAFSGGHPWRFDAQIDHNHSAKFVGLYETDASAFGDTMIHGTVEPRHVNAHYVYDLREPDLQKGPEAIVDYVKTKQIAMHVSLFELLEETLWGKPADSTDLKTPFGVAYWILRNATEGFNAENPVGFAGGRAGIDSTVAGQARWANYGGSYATLDKTDAIRKMRRMAKKIRFRSVVSHSQPELGTSKNGIYANCETALLLEEILEAQNMNLGNDLDSKGGKTVFKSRPITEVPYLDADTTNPIYFIDWKWMQLGTVKGWENNLTEPYRVGDKHNVRRVDLDATMQLICTNLRRQGVLYQS